MLKAIGSGNYGRVYQVADYEGNIRAIKISEDLISITNEYRGMMELKNYSFIPAVYDFDDFRLGNKTYYFIVMDYIDGYNLRKIRDKVDLNVKRILRIGLILVSMMEKISRLGYKYTDIKLDNIVIDRKGKIYIVDFGSLVKRTMPTKEYTPAYNINSWDFKYKHNPTLASLFSITMIMVSLISGKEYNPLKYDLDYIIKEIQRFPVDSSIKCFLIGGLKGRLSDYHLYYKSLSSLLLGKENKSSLSKIDYLLIISIVSFVFILILGIKTMLT